MTRVLHYGHHATATGAHFATIAAQHGWRVEARSRRAHIRLTGLKNVDTYTWIDSGILSFPLNAPEAPFPTSAYLIDVHLNLETNLLRAALFDVVFIAQLDYLERFREVNPNTHWLPLAAPRAFTETTRDPTYDVGFVGNVRPGSRRESLLLALEDKFRINDWRRSYDIAEMGDIYRQSRVVVNDPILGDLNMRFFEAMASGAAVVTPAIQNGLDRVATAGKHYAAADFNDEDALVETVRELLNSGDDVVLGTAARALVKAAHTYEDRFASIQQRLEDAGCTAPARATRRDARRVYARLAAREAAPELAAPNLTSLGWTDAVATGNTALAALKAVKRYVVR